MLLILLVMVLFFFAFHVAAPQAATPVKIAPAYVPQLSPAPQPYVQWNTVTVRDADGRQLHDPGVEDAVRTTIEQGARESSQRHP